MNERVAAGLLSLLVPVLSTPSCNRPATAYISAERELVSEWRDGKLVLGSPSLTAGIPGDGPLTIEEIRRWLSQEGIHEPLDLALPVGLADAVSFVSIHAENPLTRAKIELGRQLFFDRRLSKYGTMACASCHVPEQDFSAHGVMPESRLNPPVCFNRLFSTRQSWNGRDQSLEHQIAGPIANPHEMGMTTEDCANRLKSIDGYRIQFHAIFGRLDFESVGAALASFQRALITGPSPWDYRRLLARYENRHPDSFSAAERELVRTLREGAHAHPMSAAAIRGESLFFSERTGCESCHGGPNLTDEAYHNIGAGMEAYNADLGRFEITQRDEDRGAFKTPTLRNVARTSPYMHNGQFDTLREVVDWFDGGGFVHANLDPRIRPLNLTRDEKRDLIAFLESLTGPLPPVEVARLPE
jgi:cytochrome c peroxidase